MAAMVLTVGTAIAAIEIGIVDDSSAINRAIPALGA